MHTTADHALHERPAELLQRLLRFDTTNPPGHERACIEWIAERVRGAGIEPTLLAKEDGRPNLLARLPGRGEAPPFLMQGHADVVPAEGTWSREPFGGEVADGYIWGRGAL